MYIYGWIIKKLVGLLNFIILKFDLICHGTFQEIYKKNYFVYIFKGESFSINGAVPPVCKFVRDS